MLKITKGPVIRFFYLPLFFNFFLMIQTLNFFFNFNASFFYNSKFDIVFILKFFFLFINFLNL